MLFLFGKFATLKQRFFKYQHGKGRINAKHGLCKYLAKMYPKLIHRPSSYLNVNENSNKLPAHFYQRCLKMMRIWAIKLFFLPSKYGIESRNRGGQQFPTKLPNNI